MQPRRALAFGLMACTGACFADEGPGGSDDDDAGTSTGALGSTTQPDETSTGAPTTSQPTSSTTTSSSTTDATSGGSSGPAAGWRQTIDIDTSQLGERLVDVPVLLRLLPDRVDYGAMADDGSDVRVYDVTDDVLPFEIERWESNGESLLWVRVQELRPGEPAAVVLGYGEPGGVLPDPTEVWSADYLGVWHFAESLDDSTAYGFDFVAPSTAPVDAVGAVGRGVRFQVDGDWIEVADDDLLDLTEALTVEAWVMPTEVDPAAGNAFVERKGSAYRLIAVQQSTGTPRFVVHQADDVDVPVDAGSPLRAGTWAWLAGTFDGNAAPPVLQLVVDDALPVESNATGPLDVNSSELRLGGAPWLGAMDEVRISAVARSPEWLRFQYRSMTDQLTTFHAPEPP